MGNGLKQYVFFASKGGEVTPLLSKSKLAHQQAKIFQCQDISLFTIYSARYNNCQD
jgi:hypothetical protein